MLELVAPDRNVSIEREVWPRLVGNGLYGYASESYWLDIGTPARYLQGTFDIIEGNVATPVRERLGGGWLAVDGRRPGPGQGDPAGADRARRPRGRRAPTSAASSCSARTSSSAPAAPSSVPWYSRGPAIGAGCELRDCIVAAGCSVGDGTRITGGAVIGEGVRIGAGNVITRGARIFPGVELPDGAIEF